MPDTHSDTGRAVRILLVDDYIDALEMWALYLRHRGYEVLTSSDGLGAVEAAQEHLPDLVILDLDLPGITGLEAARRLKGIPRTAHIPLLAATGYSHLKQMNEARDAGFDAVLTKPCDPAVLVTEVERVLMASRPDFVPPGKGIAHSR